MTSTEDPDPDPVSSEGLRRLESRLDARLQEIAARLFLHDGRFAAMTDRLNQLDRRAEALRTLGLGRASPSARPLDVQVADLRSDAEALARDNRAVTIRATMAGVAVTIAVNATLIGATAWVACR